MTIQRFIEKVLFSFGRDLSVYSTSFLKKTLAQRMEETSSDGLTGYLQFLTRDRDEWVKLNETLQISYTLFFRNPVDASLLEAFLLPELLKHKEKSNSCTVRIWSAGCSEGHEAYTLTMIADKVMDDGNSKLPLLVFGTDISEDAISKARSGTYARNALQNVRLLYLDRCFTPKKSLFVVNDDILRKVDFSTGDLIDPNYNSPPAAIFADFDLVSCCNLMIYYQQDIQQLILEKLHHSLGRNGYLIVGESEHLIVDKFGKFRLLHPMGNIYVKKNN
jgi:chemotaxis methyl-accepting protein methylase